jgi:2-phospho-L-lactate transferase/gluconeogenesis factor (CofD/UPF0052 family)
VAVGGGHGAAQSLRAARRYAAEVTGIISVADDGGSSGRLRELLGIPAPGDLRRCIGALLPEESPLGAALEHRFEHGELAGHAFGNLLIAALAATTGDFAAGVAEAARLAGAVGRVFPATTTPVVLTGRGEDGELSGQVAISRRGGVSRVDIEPADATPPAGAVEALLKADQIVIGPGSLYTSLLYVANLREQLPETAGADVADHVRALLDHGLRLDAVLSDPAALALGDLPPALRVELAPLADAALAAHDPALLAAALSSLLQSGIACVDSERT